MLVNWERERLPILINVCTEAKYRFCSVSSNHDLIQP